ncbi:MAG: protein kinase [Paludibacteraceae bacterium]
MKLQENTLFANRYTLQKLLGRGGFSEVWLAKDNWTHLLIALKVYAPGQGMDANGLQEFCGELASVYDLNHQNLLKPQHVDTWENMPYLIMAYCAQGSLVKRIGGMSETEIRKVLHDVASGLAYLHANDVIHQDIKPDNILLDDAGNYVITDFGISTRARSTLRKSVVSSTAGGTTAYMGPERFGKEPAPIKASDVWSLGAMLYELMTGDTPFGEHGGLIQKSGAEIPTIQGNYSDELKQMVEQMLALNPWDRPTAEDLAAGYVVPSASSAPTRNRPTVAKSPITPTTPKPKRTKRIRLIVGACAAILLLPGVILVGSWLYCHHLLMDATFDTQGTHAGHEYVDLGLSVKWATCNVGASTPEGYGDYYAWGETTTKRTYDWSTYKWCNGSYDTQTKYNTSSSFGRVDNKTVLDFADDAARANWGGQWRMPTDAEWTELRNNCTWTWIWTTRNGVIGYAVTSNINGNSIFLPAAGYRDYDDLYRAGDDGYYWSSSLYTDSPGYAWRVYFDSGGVYRFIGDRYYGRSVRPVL